MKVLTEMEVSIMRGHARGTADEVSRIERKLDAFQAAITNRNHVMAVNKYIPKALAVAEKESMIDGQLDRVSFDRVYHREMNRHTRAAGLRI